MAMMEESKAVIKHESKDEPSHANAPFSQQADIISVLSGHSHNRNTGFNVMKQAVEVMKGSIATQSYAHEYGSQSNL